MSSVAQLQVLFLLIIALGNLAYLVAVRPLDSHSQMNLEILNDFGLYFCNLLTVLMKMPNLTPWQRILLGWSMIAIVASTIAISMTLNFKDVFATMLPSTKKKYQAFKLRISKPERDCPCTCQHCGLLKDHLASRHKKSDFRIKLMKCEVIGKRVERADM